MRRFRLAWVLALALTAAGWLTAHELAYRLAAPHPHSHADLMRETGHAYLVEYGSLVLTLCAVAAALSVGGLVARGIRGRPESRTSLGSFAVLPPLGFAFQEHLEPLLASGSLPPAVVLEPTFLIGFLLQLPFALTALACASALLLAADTIVRFLRRAPLLLERSAARLLHPLDLDSPRLPVLALGYGQRAPPLPLARWQSGE